MKTRYFLNGLFISLLIGTLGGERAASAQERQAAAQDAAVFVPDSASLDRIRTALASTPALRLDGPPRFYALAVSRLPTFADTMKSWNLSVTRTAEPGNADGFAGQPIFTIDLLPLLHRAIQAHHEREVRQIRARIDGELLALAAAR